tara:strand:+ start:5586 stop:5798 length:213 start_codon:yes stop_codon:yes gene_type:complete
MYFDYHAVAAILHTAIPLAAGAAGAGYFIMRSRGVGFSTSHLAVGVPMFAVGAAAAVFFYITNGKAPTAF